MFKKIFILMLISIIALSFNASATTWVKDDNIISGLPDVGSHSTPTHFEYNGIEYLIVGSRSEGFTGYEWDVESWVSNSTIINGLPGAVTLALYAPNVNYIDGNLNLIYGHQDGNFYGHTWNGTGWEVNSTIVSGLSDIGESSAPDVFSYNGNYYMISGKVGGTFNGYDWTGSSWVSNSSIVTGLGDVGYTSKPSVYNDTGTLKIIIGEGNIGADFTGFVWNGTSWNIDNDLTSGLTGAANTAEYNSAPDVFFVNVTETFQKPKIISGMADGNFKGFEFNPAPDLISPTNETTFNTTFPPLTYGVNFEWSDTGIPNYKIVVATDTAFNVVVYEKITPAKTVTAQLQSGTYYWRVAGFDANEISIGEPSDMYTFSINATIATGPTATIHGISYEIKETVDTPVGNSIIYIYNNTWSSQITTGSNGYYQFSNLAGSTVYSILVEKEGFVDSNVAIVTAVTNQTVKNNILLERRTGAGDQYDFHYVKYIVKNIFDNRYSGVDVEVFENGDVVSIFTAETGTDGAATFILNRDQEYRLEFTNATQGIDEEIIHYPKDDKYNVYVITKTIISDDQYSSEELDISVSKQTINNTHAYINVTYLDHLNETTGLSVYLNQSITNDPFNQTVIDSYSGASNSTIISFVVEDYAGETYFVNIDVDHITFGDVERTYAVKFDGMEDAHGFSQVYIWLAIGGIMFSGMIFKATNARQGAFVVCVVAWVFIILGWFDNLGDKGVLAITAGVTLATILSIAAIMAKGEKEG